MKLAAPSVLTERLNEARGETDALFQIVRPEFLYDRPIPERHRIVFYIGHLEAFDWNLLREPLKLESFDPVYDRLFAFGIDPVEGNLPTDQPADWPSLQQVFDYRDRVRRALDQALEEKGVDDLLLNVAIEHRLMHAETLSYILHQMSFDKKRGPTPRHETQGIALAVEAIDVPAGKATLGLDRGSGVFGWDNEFDAHSVDVDGFTIDRYKVTNGQFLEFLEAGGYSNRDLWTAEGWDWKNAQSIWHPAFWVKTYQGWTWRTMFGAVPLPADWPVYVSHAEAAAYAKWAGGRLPTEPEWHRAAEGAEAPVENPAAGMFDPSPVNAPHLSTSSAGVKGIVGNGWEWTSSKFEPLPGFKPFESYLGYSAPFFDGKHFVLKGGSVRTAPSMLRRSFRNWFQPHYQYVYAGFRCVHERD